MKKHIVTEGDTLSIETSIWLRWSILVAIFGGVAATCASIILISESAGKPTIWPLYTGLVAVALLMMDRRVVLRVEVRADQVVVSERGPLRKHVRALRREEIVGIRRLPVARGYSHLALVLGPREIVEITQGMADAEALEIERHLRAALPNATGK